MKENSKTDKKQSIGIDTSAFIRQVSVAGTTTDIPPTVQPVSDENEQTDREEAAQTLI